MPEMMIVALILIFLCIVLLAFLKRKNRLGDIGERAVRKVIGRTVKNQQYVLNNYILEHNGTSSQIDHIVINPRGVFVIETKNYSGEIYGWGNEKIWTQTLQYGRIKNQLNNPVKQNETHVYHVKKIVGKVPVHSVVVFVQNNTQHIVSQYVVGLNGLSSRLSQGKSVLTEETMKRLYKRLQAFRAEISNAAHVRNIKRRQRWTKKGLCPRCGGKLVLRTGKYGIFVGCSKFPKCYFKTKYKGQV